MNTAIWLDSGPIKTELIRPNTITADYGYTMVCFDVKGFLKLVEQASAAINEKLNKSDCTCKCKEKSNA